MPRNVEIKARVEDLKNIEKLAKGLSGEDGTLIEQEDTFFNSPQGYLKLRILKEAKAQLVYYERASQAGPKLSDYHVTFIENPEELKFTLEKVCGIKGVVRKHRMLYMVGQTRIHCDRVDKLGDFMELEVALEDEQNIEEGEAIAKDLMMKLNIDEEDLIEVPYMELILNKEEDKEVEKELNKEGGESGQGDV